MEANVQWVNVANDVYADRYEELKRVLEDGNVVHIYVDCIGHTRSIWVEEAYRDKLKQEYGDRLVVDGYPGQYGTTYHLQVEVSE